MIKLHHNMSDDRFRKDERLKSRKLIKELFKNGKVIFVHPIKWVYIPLSFEADTPPLKFTVSVSKRTFKKAVDRNLIKRRIREAYRLQKSDLISVLTQNLSAHAGMAIFIGKRSEDYDVISNSMNRILKKMKKEVN